MGRQGRQKLPVDTLPPHSIEAEQGLLGSILRDKSVLDDALIVINTPEYFYDLKHQTIWQAFLEMYEQQVDISVVSLLQHLKDTRQDEAVGGYAYLTELPDKTAGLAAATYFIETLREKYILRSLLRFGTELVQKIHESEADIDGLVDSQSAKFYSITEQKVASNFKNAHELVDEAMATMDKCVQNSGKLQGLSTGLIELDKLTSGLTNGEVFVIGGRPSTGKTAIGLNICEHVAVEQNLPVGIFSIEMTAQQLMMRLITSKAHVSIRNLRDGFLSERDTPRLASAAGKIIKAKLYVDDSGSLSLPEFRAKSRILVQRFGARLILVDYIQLMHLGIRMDNRNQELGKISMGIKSVAKDLDIPIIVLAQLNRELDKSSRRPRLSDLRDSGGIEADADTVGLLYIPDSKEDDSNGSDCSPTNLMIAKQRNGPTGEIPLTFLKYCTRFVDAAKVDQSDVPDQEHLPYKD